ncbi:MAG TPA: diguanylate cyclase, partial [Nevskiaceae bacterium]|nr:diguanylate cyclase [Nevskiaceae bacterium]
GTLALAGDDGNVQIYDPASNHARAIRVDAGSLVGLAPAADGGLLAASDLAAFHIAWPDPWSVIGTDAGLSGSVHGLAWWQGRWHALSGSGVYRDMAADPGEWSFQRQPWTDHEAWALLALDEHSALLAESYTLQLIENGKARPLSSATLYPRMLYRSPFDADTVYIGTEMGVAVLRRERGSWHLVLEHSTPEQVLASSIVETAPRELWIGAERNGIQKLRLSDDYRKVLQAESFGAAQGLSYGRLDNGGVYRLPEGALLAITASGMFRWDGQRFVADALGNLAQLREADESLALAHSPAGEVWAFSFKHAFRRLHDGQWRREEIANIRQGALESLDFDPSGAVLLGDTNSILHFDARRLPASGHRPLVALRSVERLAPDGSLRPLTINAGGRVTLKLGEAGLRFNYALPEFRGRAAPRYQVRLQGLDEKFSDWSDAKSISYLRIDPGEYSFQVRARDAQGQISETMPLEFVVVPPWYERRWARALWWVLLPALAALLTAALNRARNARLKAEKARLEAMVAERTHDLEHANRRLDSLAHLDGLTEVPNRRRLDEYLLHVWGQCAEQQRWLSVLVIDVDRFKNYNDAHGHLAGDDVLKQIVRVLAHCLRRAEDLVARFGGDEFVVVLPGAKRHAAAEIAESMRAHVEKSQAGATVSIGIASCEPARGGAVAELVHEADEALYQAKNTGRNRVAGGEPITSKATPV